MVYTTYYGDDWGMVHDCFTHISVLHGDSIFGVLEELIYTFSFLN
jgi:hypothetical protein